MKNSQLYRLEATMFLCTAALIPDKITALLFIVLSGLCVLSSTVERRRESLLDSYEVWRKESNNAKP